MNMATFRGVAAELRPYLLPGIHSASGSAEQSIAAWTRSGSYGISIAPSAGGFQLDPVMPNVGLGEAFACEVRRFSLAAFETCLRNERAPGLRRALAWPMISNYYAAYFSAHAICRMFGRSVSHLDASIAADVGRVASSYVGGTHNVPSGLYAVSYDGPTGVMRYLHFGGVGGSHEALWKVFLTLLDELQGRVLQGGPNTIEVQATATYLGEIARRLKSKGANGGNWLSVLRNEVNYRQLYGIWYPYSVPDASAEVVDRRMREWLRERTDWSSVVGRNTELNCAADLASSMLSLLFWLLKDLRARASARRHFVEGMTFALLRQQATVPSVAQFIEA